MQRGVGGVGERHEGGVRGAERQAAEAQRGGAQPHGAGHGRARRLLAPLLRRVHV